MWNYWFAPQVLQGLRPALELFYKKYGEKAKQYDGPLVLRFVISAAGRVSGLHVMLDRVFTAHKAEEDWSLLTNELIELLGSCVFPTGAAQTDVTLPLRFDGR